MAQHDQQQQQRGSQQQQRESRSTTMSSSPQVATTADHSKPHSSVMGALQPLHIPRGGLSPSPLHTAAAAGTVTRSETNSSSVVLKPLLGVPKLRFSNQDWVDYGHQLPGARVNLLGSTERPPLHLASFAHISLPHRKNAHQHVPHNERHGVEESSLNNKLRPVRVRAQSVLSDGPLSASLLRKQQSSPSSPTQIRSHSSMAVLYDDRTATTTTTTMLLLEQRGKRQTALVSSHLLSFNGSLSSVEGTAEGERRQGSRSVSPVHPNIVNGDPSGVTVLLASSLSSPAQAGRHRLADLHQLAQKQQAEEKQRSKTTSGSPKSSSPRDASENSFASASAQAIRERELLGKPRYHVPTSLLDNNQDIKKALRVDADAWSSRASSLLKLQAMVPLSTTAANQQRHQQQQPVSDSKKSTRK